MLFNSPIFLLIFLPAVLLIFELVSPRLRLWVLMLASLVFYGTAGIEPLLAMLFAIVWVHCVLLIRHRLGDVLARILVVSIPIVLLILFRYLDFALDIATAGEETRRGFSFFLDIMVPAGISFYTFQLIGYGLDVTAGDIEREPSLHRLITFIALFPQLIAGPIVRYRQLRDQLRDIELGRMVKRNYAEGFRHLTVGLFYKVMFADSLHFLHQKVSVSSGDYGVGDLWLSIVIYSFQIYYDFYGYSLMAIGLGILIGIRLPLNFLRPYLSPNPKIFWRRWHVTLSMWLRDYVYFRLGGNRNYVRNILIVFLVVGLWHGADWSFIVWGAYHGVLVLLYGVTASIWDRAPHAMQVAVTFILVSFGWPLFYLDLSGYVDLITALFDMSHGFDSSYRQIYILFVAVIAVWTFLPPVSKNGGIKALLWRLESYPVVQAATVVLILAGPIPLSSPFIYFRF